jgi:hypothetical protein
MTTPRTLPATDIVAMDAVLTDLHAAICIVPGDKNAEAMVGVFKRHGIYKRTASSFTAREGGDPLTKRGHRIFSLRRWPNSTSPTKKQNGNSPHDRPPAQQDRHRVR